MEQDMTTAMPQMDMGGAPQQKSGKGLKIATALMAIIALCGIGFGVFGMMQSQKKDDKASDLKVQIKNADGTTTTLETPEITTADGTTTVTITDTNVKKSNPIISATSPRHYRLQLKSNQIYLPENYEPSSISISIENGEINSCLVEIGGDVTRQSNCNINGLSGKIYKAVEIERGQDASGDSIGFILENGSVEYLSLDNALGKSDFTVKKAKIDGFVTDVVNYISFFEEDKVGGGITTVFVLSDGSYVEYDDSMFE